MRCFVNELQGVTPFWESIRRPGPWRSSARYAQCVAPRVVGHSPRTGATARALPRTCWPGSMMGSRRITCGGRDHLSGLS
jgi:hypothetical protein